MTSAKHVALLSRMQAARRQTQHQLDLIDRKIRRRMLLLVPPFGRRQRRPYGDKARQTGTSDRHVPRTLSSGPRGTVAERQHELGALSRKLARQDAAIAGLVARQDP